MTDKVQGYPNKQAFCVAPKFNQAKTKKVSWWVKFRKQHPA